MEALAEAVDLLCRAYPVVPAATLRDRTQKRLAQINRLLSGRLTLDQHRELYMERRTYSTARKVWPEAEGVCVSESLELDEYVGSLGDPKLVVDMLVGDLQRVIEYPKLGYAIEHPAPGEVHDWG